jgi:hypothetical protein
MSTMVAELYDALRQAGVEQELAQRAASAVLAVDARMDLATKSDLLALKADMAEMRATISEMRAEVSEMKVELIKWNVGAMAVLTGIFAAIVRLG